MALSNPQEGLKANKERWEGYLTKILRKDMKPEYDRIAVKAVVTLISNWRTHRGGLLHEGIVPSHAAYYFVGFWAGTLGVSLLLWQNSIRNWPRTTFVPCLTTSSLTV